MNFPGTRKVGQPYVMSQRANTSTQVCNNTNIGCMFRPMQHRCINTLSLQNTWKVQQSCRKFRLEGSCYQRVKYTTLLGEVKGRWHHHHHHYHVSLTLNTLMCLRSREASPAPTLDKAAAKTDESRCVALSPASS